MDEDLFDDDGGLDDLPSNTLQELEAKAFRATQNPAAIAGQQQPPSSDYGLQDDEEVIDLDAPPRANVITARPNPPSQSSSKTLPFQASQSARPLDEVTQREQWRVQRYGVTAQNRLPAFKQPWPTSAGVSAGRPQLSQPSAPQQTTVHDLTRTRVPNGEQDVTDDAASLNVAGLQERIAEASHEGLNNLLERSHAALIQENRNATAQAFAKAGEIAIIRANQEKAAKEYESKLCALQELHAQEAARHRTEIEAARKDRQQMETSNKFLQHDLAQETDRARNARKALKGGDDNTRARPSPASTPKKKSSLPYRDGFDDGEVLIISPTKPKEKQGPATPTKPSGKRKRPDQEASPAKQLSFSDQDGSLHVGQTTPPAQPTLQLPLRSRKGQTPDRRFNFVQLILNHRQSDDRRTIELLTAYSLPSSPNTALSSHVYDALHSKQDDERDETFKVHFCREVLQLWSKCLSEMVIAAIPLLMSLTTDALMRSEDKISVEVAKDAVPLAVQTADLVATPKARVWMNPVANKGPPPKLEAMVKPLDCLDLMYLIARRCSEDDEALRTFWSCIEHDFILVMLHKAQSLDECILMLEMTGLSVLKSSFGAINKVPDNGEEYATKQRQHQNEYNLVSRLANLLVDRRRQERLSQPAHEDLTALQSLDQPDSVRGAATKSDETGQQNADFSVLDLRLASLGLLTHLCSTEHGGKLLASHRFATGRIIRLLHESILALYNYSSTTHERATACVNHSVMLLAHLCFVHGDVLDLRARLAAEPSGHHKHLVALSRVAFSQSESIIEEGIWSESAEVAHRMLDEFLSPEEGDAVVSVFSSMRSDA